MGGSLPQNASSKTTPARASDDSASLSMRELENELVDISSSSSGLSSKVKLLFAKSKGSPSLAFWLIQFMSILVREQKITSPDGSLS